MAKYYIEISEDDIATHDEVIMELGNIKEIRRKATEILSSMIGQIDDDQSQQKVVAVVRNDRREIVYSAVMTFADRDGVVGDPSGTQTENSSL